MVFILLPEGQPYAEGIFQCFPMRLAFSQQNNKQSNPHHATCGFWWGWYKFPRWGKEYTIELI